MPAKSAQAAGIRGDTQSRAALVLLVAAAITALLYVVPYGRELGYPLVLLSTVAHEMGHGIAGVLVGGTFESLSIGSDASGLANISGYDGRFAQAFVSAGGLCGPAVTAAIAFALARKPRLARFALFAAGIFLVVSLVWVVRNVFGWVFVGATAAALLAISVKASEGTAQVVLAFFGVQLALSVFSRGDYLFTDTAHTAMGTFPSDVANMATALFLPYWFWGALCGAFSVLVLVVGAWLYVRAPGRPAEAARAR